MEHLRVLAAAPAHRNNVTAWTMIATESSITSPMRAQPFAVPENLFRKITDEERVDWQQRFSGVRA